MAASSSRPLPVEERLKQLDDKLEKLKNMLQFQLDFLENLDSEAGRRMEQLEQDLSFVKIGFTEELDKLHQELKSPQEKFEDRIGDLEDKLSKLNLEWGDSSEK
jgi:predicted  nucleic acid-binding Zn-ribbon protein